MATPPRRITAFISVIIVNTDRVVQGFRQSSSTHPKRHLWMARITKLAIMKNIDISPWQGTNSDYPLGSRATTQTRKHIG
jgi:hypothetical protein